jgi:hypothetical protein
MRQAMRSLLKGMRVERKTYDRIADWLTSKADWPPYSSNGKLYEKLSGDASEAFDAWRIKVKLEAKRYGITIPWKWNKP